VRNWSFGGIQTISDLVTTELYILGVFLLLCFVYRLRRGGVWSQRETLSHLIFLLFVGLLCYSEAFSQGRAILSEGILMPGSLVTRSISINIPIWLRRAIEPSMWFLLLLVFTASYDAMSRVGCISYFVAGEVLLGILLLEAAFLIHGGYVARVSEVDSEWLLLGHFELTQTFILVLLIATVAELMRLSYRKWAAKSRGVENFRSDLSWLIPGSLIVYVLVLGGFWAASWSSQQIERLRVGAHYYSWFPENWAGGTAGEYMEPPIMPLLGHYSSEAGEVFLQHAAWAREAGVDFFVFDWWPRRPEIGKRIYSHVVRERRLGQMQFALMYESLDLREPDDAIVPGETDRVVYLTAERTIRLKKHWEYLAKYYMADESYLRIDGKAVLFIYATRHLVGPVAKGFKEARAHVKDRTGIDLYLVGDEAFFNVLSYSPRGEVLLLAQGVPNWDRLTAFDAITSYNPYDEKRSEHAGAAGADRFLNDVADLYRRYRAVAATVGIRFIPGVLPGYNDRGVRLQENHFVLPRYLDHVGEKSFFSAALQRIGFDQLDDVYPILCITSWNEWNEGTQIEPTRSSPGTRRDSSHSGADYTQGEYYLGYEMGIINELANQLKTLD